MKKALPILLLGGAALLFCLGVSALAINFAGARSAPVDLTKWQVPSDLVQANKINPAVALEPLAGVPDMNAMDDELAAGDWEGALSQIAYSTEFSDANRAGTLLLLASRYAGSKQYAKAAWAYQYAVYLATVSPLPGELTRTQTLLESAQGLHNLQMDVAARAALDQAYLLAQYGFSMPRDTRAHVLAQIGRAYEQFGVPGLAAEARQKSAEAESVESADAVNTARRPFKIQSNDIPDNEDIKAKFKERVTAAKELVDSLNLNPPKSAKDLPDDLVRTLGDRLYEEDGLRMDYYAQQADASTDAVARIAILRDKLRWLAVKLRVARGAYGLSLVPEWESDASKIAGELNDTYAEYFQITQDQARGAEKPADADRSEEDVLRASLVEGRWGLYNKYDEADLRSQLDDVSKRLRDEQVPALRLDSFMRGNTVYYLLVPDELYGLGEKALPR